jgi:serine/threonine-protein kinase
VIYAQKCVVPRVKELSRSKAEKKIRAAGCLVGKIKKKHSKKVKKGHAVGTKPAAGKTLKPGAKIELIISEGR